MLEKLFPDPFLENWNWTYLSINSFIQFVFIVYQVQDYRNILQLSCKSLAFTSNKTFSKNGNSSGTSLPTSCSAWFLEKNFTCYILLSDKISLSGCRETLWNRCIVIVCEAGCEVINFEINLILLLKIFFSYMTKKSRQKFKYLESETSF